MNKTEILERLSGIGKLKPGWDGYGANSITVQILLTAQVFVSQVPEEIFPDHIEPTGDGDIEFSWYDKKENLVALVSISEPHKGHLSIFSDNTVTGEFFAVEDFQSVTLLQKLKEVFHDE